MRSRFVITLLILVAVILALTFWLRPKHGTIVSLPIRETVLQTNGAATQNSESQVLSTSNHSASNYVGSAFTQARNDPQKQREIYRQVIEQKNSPINFYGKVIDQNSNPVPAAKIKIGIRHWYVPLPDVLNEEGRTIQLEQTSDTDGRFEFHGETGDGFGVGITKDGYSSPPNARYGFGPQAGTYGNPIIFKMWKFGEKAQLVSGSKFWGVAPDGQTYTVDFLEQSKVESNDAPGDIRISITRPAQIKPHTHFDWSFSIVAINGGLIKTDDDFLYLAPESGYQPGYQITMSATNVNWKRELDGLQFYLKSRDGKVYGNFKFDLIPDYNAVSIFNVSWSVNPNGSRNLQP